MITRTLLVTLTFLDFLKNFSLFNLNLFPCTFQIISSLLLCTVKTKDLENLLYPTWKTHFEPTSIKSNHLFCPKPPFKWIQSIQIVLLTSHNYVIVMYLFAWSTLTLFALEVRINLLCPACQIRVALKECKWLPFYSIQYLSSRVKSQNGKIER